MKDSYISTLKDYNVIIVDWDLLSGAPYSNAAANTKIAGKQTACLLQNLKNIGLLNYEDVHIIGHSLGAQAAGFCGQYLNSKIGRITGLEAAKPGFEGHPHSDRLDRTDALFVDGIHTSIAGVLGTAENIGDCDFYINGGYAPQPGCPASDQFCSHRMSIDFFKESITAGIYKGYQSQICYNYIDYIYGACIGMQSSYMGDSTPHNTRGVFYLQTNPASPFAKA